MNLLSCCHFGVLMNKDAAHILAHVFLGSCAGISLGNVTVSGNAELSQGWQRVSCNTHCPMERRAIGQSRQPV